MAYLVRGEHDRDAVRGYLLEALEFCWNLQDSGGLEWEDEPGYVQWAGWPEGVQIEISGEEYLGRDYTEQEHRRLVELGFSPPQDDLPNYYRRFISLSELPVAAEVLVTCLFELLIPPPPGHAGSKPAPTPAELPPCRMLLLAPVSKVDPADVRTLTRSLVELLRRDAPVAIVDASWSSGLSLPYDVAGHVDDTTKVRTPRSRSDRLLLSGWADPDDGESTLKRVSAGVGDVMKRLRAAGWVVLLVGPPVSSHTMWAYQQVALPLSGRLLMIGAGFEWEHKTTDVAELVERARSYGHIEEVAVVVSHEPGQAALQHLAVHERWLRPADLAGPLTWLHHWLGVHQPGSAAAGRSTCRRCCCASAASGTRGSTRTSSTTSRTAGG
jgi:hypothetical protein